MANSPPISTPFDRTVRSYVHLGFAAFLCALLIAPEAGQAFAASAKTALLSGRVLSADGKKPLEGAVLKAVHIISQRVYTSSPTDASGHFALGELPSGYYDVGIDSGTLLFVAGSVINLAEGGKVNLDFVLQPYTEANAEWWQGQKREIPVLGQEQGMAKVVEKSRATSGGKSFWKKPGGIAIIVIGGVGIVGAAAGGGGGGGGGGGSSASQSQP